MEKLVVEIRKDLFDNMAQAYNYFEVPSNYLKANEDYTIKEVKIEDDFFKDDPVWHTMKKESNALYKRLKEYEFKQRNK